MKEWLIEKSKSKGLSQSNLSVITGIDRTTIVRYETGLSDPTVANAKKLGKLLGFNWTKFYS